MCLAAVVLAAVFYRELGRLTASSLRSGLLVGFFLFIGNELQTEGLKYTTPSKSAFLTGVSVVLVPILLALFWKRSLNLWTRSAWSWLLPACTFRLSRGRPGAGSICGAWIMAICSLWGPQWCLPSTLSLIFNWARNPDPGVAADHGGASCGNGVSDDSDLSAGGEGLCSLVCTRALGIGITGFLSLALAFAIQAWAQQFTPATHTALIFTLEPVFAWLTSFIFLGECLGTRAGIGAVCILAGLLISEEKASAESMAVSPDHTAVPSQHG
jgi:EamA-like transporter family protein